MTRSGLVAIVASLTTMTPTPQSDDFPSGSFIATVGGTSAATLDPGGASDNIYTAHYYLSLTINAHSQTFGSASLVVAIETNDGTGWVERAAESYFCSYSTSWPPPYAARTCSWSDLQQAITVPGLGLTAGIRLKAKSFSTSNGAGGSFAIRGGDGAGTNPGTYNGVTYATEPYGVQVGPDPGSQSVYAGSTGNVATFTVRNLGSQGTLTYALSVVGCTAPLASCTSDAPSVTVGQGLTQNVTVHFDAQNTTGTGAIVLRATHSASGTTDDGTINVSLQSFAVEVGPDPGSQSTGAGSSGNAATFTVKNNGNQGTLIYALSVVTCSAPLTNCTSDAGSVSVAQGVTVNTTVHFNAQSTTGTGALVLRATHTASGTSDDGTINVTVDPASYAVQAGPDPGSQGVPFASPGNLATFTVQNLGNEGTLTYALSIQSCAAPVTNCTSDAGSVTVGQGSTANATVHFDAQNQAGTGAIVLRAMHTASGTSNDGTINVTTTTPQSDDFQSGAIGGVGGTVQANLDPGNANSGTYTVHYFVSVTINAHSQNYGSATVVIAIETNDGSGWVERAAPGVSCGYPSGPPPYPNYTCPAWTHEQVTITVAGLGLNSAIRLRAKSFSTSNGAGGSFAIRGGDGTGSNPETYNGVTYATDWPPSYAVEVQNPPNQTVYTNSSGNVATFPVQNLGNRGTLTYALSIVSCTAPLTNCTSDAASIDVGQGSTGNAGVHFNAQGTSGTGTIVLRATHSPSSTSDDGTITVTVIPPPSYAVEVGPDPGGLSPTGGSTSNLTYFTVKNNGNQGQLTYALNVVSCTAPATNCTSDAASINLGQGVTGLAGVHFDAQNVTGVGSIVLRATHTPSGTSNDGTMTVTVFVLSSVSGGALTLDYRYLLQETAEAYDSAGRVARLKDARAIVDTFTYGGNTKKAFLTQVRRVKDGTGTIDLVTDVTYLNGFVASIRDEGGASRSFTYDGWGRLREIKNNSGLRVRAFGYTYSRTLSNGWAFDPLVPNSVSDTTFIQHTPTIKYLANTEYIDGLGRIRQKIEQDGGTYLLTASEYDAMGRIWRVWKPYVRSGVGYDQSFATNATSFYNTYNSTSSAKPYVETLYRPDALARVQRVVPEYIGATPLVFVQHAYGLDVAAGQQITEITDESGNWMRSFTDIFENQVKISRGSGATEVSASLAAYNILDQRTQGTDPRGLVTTFTLDTRQLLISKSSPDAGSINHRYDRNGNVRYTQDANKVAAGTVYFTTYDFANRPLTSGLGTAALSSLDPDAPSPPPLESTTGNWLVVRKYDAKPTNVFPWSLFWTQISPLNPANLAGRLAATASKSNGSWQVTLFSYDGDGRITNRYTYTHRNGTTTVLTALNTTVAYVRDLRGVLLERRLTVGTNIFNHWFDYDARGLLWKTFVSTSSTKPTSPDVTYTYRPSGRLQNRQFAGGPLVPLHYTIREQLDSIGNPGGTTPTPPFAARYAYNANGTISEAEFYSAGSPSTQKRYKYAFPAYDALNRLQTATYSGWNNGTWVSNGAYNLSGITYDASGNLTALQRRRQDGSLIDNLTYGNSLTSNRLTSLVDAVPTTAESWDAESAVLGAFTYDANGNLTKAPAPYSLTSVTYDYANKPISITRNGTTTTTYRYDDTGNRIAKQVGTGNPEMYILEGGMSLAVFTVNSSGSVVTKFFNVTTGTHVVGRQPNTGSRLFYHTDLLGSTRAVVQGTTIVESYDFEPWGLLMPGRTLGSGTKEGFTGKEQDAETGFAYFGARYYMAALGRWASTDPVADKYPDWSPYTYALDNPNAVIDPNGAETIYLEGEAAQEFFRELQKREYHFEWRMAERAEEKQSQRQAFELYVNAVANDFLNRWNLGSQLSQSSAMQQQQQQPQQQEPKRRSLGVNGNLIRAQLDDDFSKDLFERFWLGEGDLHLTQELFTDIADVASRQSYTAAGRAHRKGEREILEVRVVSFYGTKYAASLGSATLYYDKRGRAVGLFDVYNFDVKEWGDRPFFAELKVRGVVLNTPKEAKGFVIRYP